MNVEFVQLESDGFLADLNFHYRPEIREWLRQTFFFTPTKNDPAGFDEQNDGPEPVAMAESADDTAQEPAEKSYISLIR
jgi:hypothetical protein